MFAAIVADRMGRCVVMSPDKVGKHTALIVSDSLGDGQALKAAVGVIESNGGSVIRIGCIVERKDEGARKSRVLRGYPFEALVEI
jgi:adenine/guanine phosphoribosyltransferase-like PRPP-binding protein